MRAFLTKKTVALAAGETQQHAVTGNLFVCVSTTAPFKLSLDGSEEIDMDQGWTVDVGALPWKFIVFRNPTAGAMVIEYYAGNAAMTYSRPTSLVTASNASTYAKGSGVVALAGGAHTDFTGLDGANRRKQFVVQNLDLANVVNVLDGAGNVLSQVLPQTSWTVETGGALALINPGGAAVNYAVAEVFYS